METALSEATETAQPSAPVEQAAAADSSVDQAASTAQADASAAESRQFEAWKSAGEPKDQATEDHQERQSEGETAKADAQNTDPAKSQVIDRIKQVLKLDNCPDDEIEATAKTFASWPQERIDAYLEKAGKRHADQSSFGNKFTQVQRENEQLKRQLAESQSRKQAQQQADEPDEMDEAFQNVIGGEEGKKLSGALRGHLKSNFSKVEQALSERDQVLDRYAKVMNHMMTEMALSNLKATNEPLAKDPAIQKAVRERMGKLMASGDYFDSPVPNFDGLAADALGMVLGSQNFRTTQKQFLESAKKQISGSMPRPSQTNPARPSSDDDRSFEKWKAMGNR